MKKNFKQETLRKTLLTSIVPFVILMAISLIFTYQNKLKAVDDALDILANEKSAAVNNYFETIFHQIETSSHDLTIINAMKGFREAYNNLSNSDTINSYDQNLFNKRYSYQLKNTINATKDNLESWKSISPTARHLQSKYIFENKEPIGEKHNLTTTYDNSEYDKLHTLYHPLMREFLESFGYYDIFLVEPQNGNVVYSVFKEVDYATSLFNGPYKGTKFAEAVKQVIKSPKTVFLTDFDIYAPSYNAQAAFIAAPIKEENKLLGVLVFQMPIDKIKDTLKLDDKFKTFLNSYIIDKKGVIKSDIPSMDVSTIGMKSSANNIENIFSNIDEVHFSEYLNLNDESVKSAAKKLNIKGQEWAVVSEYSKEYYMADIYKFVSYSFIVLIIGIAFILWVSNKTINSITKPITEIYTAFSGESVEVEKRNEAVSNISNQVHNFAVESSHKTNEIKSDMSNVSGLVQTIASAIEEMNASIMQIAENANDSKAKVYNINQTVQETSGEVESLLLASDQISNVTSLIQDLSDQTNLLALNASIEAARAGEAGRGFAVVADEVKKLAERTNKAVQEIESSVSSIKTASGNTSSSMHTVNEGILEISNQVEYVSTSVTEQNQAANDITASVDEMVHLIQKVEAESIAIEDTSQETLSLSKNLKNSGEESSLKFKELQSNINNIVERLGLKND